jgi:hypothetical protein
MTTIVVNASTIVTVDPIDEITVTTDPILAMTIGIDVIITATTAATTNVTTTVATTAPTGATEVIVVMIATMIVTTVGVMINVTRTTTTAKTTTVKSGHLRHHPKGGNPNGAFQKANRKINFIVGGHQAIKTNQQTRSNAREIGHVNTENPRPLRWSEFPITFSRKDHWVHSPDPGTYLLVVNPIVNGSSTP